MLKPGVRDKGSPEWTVPMTEDRGKTDIHAIHFIDGADHAQQTGDTVTVDVVVVGQCVESGAWPSLCTVGKIWSLPFMLAIDWLKLAAVHM